MAPDLEWINRRAEAQWTRITQPASWQVQPLSPPPGSGPRISDTAAERLGGMIREQEAAARSSGSG